MSRRFLLLLPTALAAIALACSSSDDSGAPAAVFDAGADGVAPIVVYDAAMPVLDAACNELSTSGPQITTTDVLDATAPEGVGGTVVDGTYTLTELDWYMGDSLDQLPPTTSTSLVISGGGVVWQSAGTDTNSGAFTINYAAATDGDMITLNETCPSADTEIDETFTATATTLTLFDTYEGEPYIRVYTKQ